MESQEEEEEEKGEKIKQCQIWRQTQTDGERIYW